MEERGHCLSATSNPLPVESIRAELAAALRRGRNFILTAPTGSGKSTRVPPMLLAAGVPGQVIVLQPRRLPARMLARRVAAETATQPGQFAGWQVRFDRCAGPATRILYVTEGLLLRRLLGEPNLKGVGAILFDEFHERHLDGDLGLALALRLQRERRPDLVLGVLSATLDAAALAARLPDCALLHAEGRMYPVEVRHQAAGAAPVWEAAAQAFRNAARAGMDGDCLIFMPGAREIHRTLAELDNLPEARGYDRHALHGELPPVAQDAAVTPGARPKIIVATNVAETSLTIPGVRLVIDSGLARIPDFDPARGINTLLVQRISQASAEQRAGRAGRVAPGVCIRLWGAAEHRHRPLQTEPEVRRLDLAEALLLLRCAGIDDVRAFPWIEPPPEAHLARAERLLHDLGAVTAGGALSATGRRMAAFPLHPRQARVLLAGAAAGCLRPVCLLLALAQGRSLLLPLDDQRRAAAREEQIHTAATAASDLLLDMQALQWAAAHDFAHAFCREWGIHHNAATEALRVAGQLESVAQEQGLAGAGDAACPAATLCRCLLAGYSDQLALRRDRATLRCDLVHGRRGEISRHSVVQNARLLISTDIEERELRGEVTVLLQGNSAVEEAWLEEDFPDDFSEERVTAYDPATRRVACRRQRRFRDLVLLVEDAGTPDADAAARLLAEAVQAHGLVLKNWDGAADNWIRRVNCLARSCPELEIALIDAAARRMLLEHICHGAVSYKEVKDRPVMPELRAWLTAEVLPLVDLWTPERFPLAGDRTVKLRYEEDGSVVLPAVLQQLYDVPGAALRICDGRLPLKVEILSPARRPVQVTTDLDAFWSGSYPAVKKELRGRYPKHAWR